MSGREWRIAFLFHTRKWSIFRLYIYTARPTTVSQQPFFDNNCQRDLIGRIHRLVSQDDWMGTITKWINNNRCHYGWFPAIRVSDFVPEMGRNDFVTKDVDRVKWLEGSFLIRLSCTRLPRGNTDFHGGVTNFGRKNRCRIFSSNTIPSCEKRRMLMYTYIGLF